MSDTFGKNIRFTIYGESHGESVGGELCGIPAGLSIDMDYINKMLSRRKPIDKIGTERHERDEVIFNSGIQDGHATGEPISFSIPNTDVKENGQDYSVTPRPGHADYTALVHGILSKDFPGIGHLSGRLTAPLTIAGAIASLLLKQSGIRIGSHILSIAGINDEKFPLNDADIENKFVFEKTFPVINDEAGEIMKQAIIAAKNSGDSVGGIIETAVLGIPAGAGEPFFDSIESVISSAVFSVPGVKGIEFGLGFKMAEKFGSEVNDAFYFNDEKLVKTKTNNNGGINGGISNGMPITFNCVIKPTPSIPKEQETVDLVRKENTTIKIKGRNDACIVPRACVVIEAVCALALADLLSNK